MGENPHGEFMERYKPIHVQFVRYCGSHGYGIMDVQDLVQESVLQTMQYFNTLRDKEKLLYFMIGVANNIIKNTLRRKKFSAVLDEKQLKSLEARVADPAMAIDIQYLYKALNRLPLKMKEAVVLFEINGMNMKEIADIQACSEGAVKTRISRGRDKLRELLATDNVTYELHGNKTLFSLILYHHERRTTYTGFIPNHSRIAARSGTISH